MCACATTISKWMCQLTLSSGLIKNSRSYVCYNYETHSILSGQVMGECISTRGTAGNGIEQRISGTTK